MRIEVKGTGPDVPDGNLTRTVKFVEVSSEPRSMATGSSTRDTYGLDETIVITVIAGEPVMVEGDPVFRFSLTNPGEAANIQQATYDATRSRGRAFAFVYTVQADDRDTDGIEIGDHTQTFILDDDDRIFTTSQNIDIDRTYRAVGTRSDHKVDGSLTPAFTVPPHPTRPTLASATTTTLTVEWTHPGDGGEPLVRNAVRYRMLYTLDLMWTNVDVGTTPVTHAVITNLQANNWNLLGEGEHEVFAYVDGVELGRATATVTTLGVEFLRDVEGECVADDFPAMGRTVTLEWQQTSQNFVIAGGSAPARANTGTRPSGLTGYLENPGPHSFQSGIGVISGWVCDADTVELAIGTAGRQPAAYGTERLDTLAACGDTANGFGLLFNWNLLGEGAHEVVAFVDGEELGRATVRVTTLGAEFLRDVEGECVVEDFPMPGETVLLEWQQNSQNFVITDVEGGSTL